jgi:uncharacterized protein
MAMTEAGRKIGQREQFHRGLHRRHPKNRRRISHAFIKYIEEGTGGWIGFHHAPLLGEFDGFAMWSWFRRFMGGVRFKNYIATFVTGSVTVEDNSHPAMKGIASPFLIEKEEWYTYDTTSRPNVHVLASVDENTYTPSTDQKMETIR